MKCQNNFEKDEVEGLTVPGAKIYDKVQNLNFL